MTTTPTLKPSPRLYVAGEATATLNDRLHSPYLRSLAAQVLGNADWLVRIRPLPEGFTPTYQPGTRAVDSYLGCLTCAWVLTGDPRYRKAALRHLAGLTAWNQISCEANSGIPASVVMPFCLSYGELSATTGLMYDLFRPDMTEEERAVFRAFFDKFLLRASLKALEQPPWWAHKGWSNWNGVCAGGMGILALAVHDDMPEARDLIPFVEQSLEPYFQSYVENGGGCHEGTGYWNYGMNFAMRYLLSWENATGQEHPALGIPELGRSLHFPIDFTGISFGDNDGWGPTCFFFLLARRLGNKAAALNAATWLREPVPTDPPRRGGRVAGGEILYAADCIPTEAEMEKLRAAHAKRKVPVARVYTGMDWAVLADDEAFPSLRMALRGGSSRVAGHGMLDLLSLRCRVNGELMITDQQDGGYMATTFGKRGNDLYGRSAASKSTLFVDGLGCGADSACDVTEVVRGRSLLGVRIDASHVILPRWKDVFIGRLVLLVENAYWLVVDTVRGANEHDGHWLESRFHTLADCRNGRDWAALQNGRERMRMTFAALEGGHLQTALGTPSQPQVPQTVIYRWMATAPAPVNLHVTALTPGAGKPLLRLHRPEEGAYHIEVGQPGGRSRRIRLTADLRLQG